jgi:hypothetical protein
MDLGEDEEFQPTKQNEKKEKRKFEQVEQIEEEEDLMEEEEDLVDKIVRKLNFLKNKGRRNNGSFF